MRPPIDSMLSEDARAIVYELRRIAKALEFYIDMEAGETGGGGG